MPRQPTVPELLPSSRDYRDLLVWDIWEEVYPRRICAALIIETHHDPFSGSAERYCHHARVELGGLGVVDIGWHITGEPPPPLPIASADIDPLWLCDQRMRFGGITPGAFQPGKGCVGIAWRRVVEVARLTMVGLAVRVVELSTRHVATDHFLSAARAAEYHETGMMRRWLTLSAADLYVCGGKV